MQNKSITKNTVYLTIRMIFLMVINFYTSRVILDKLGVEDYGVYNIVSSIAIAFAFFGSSLTNATQRFVTIELGKNNIRKANQILNLHFEVYFIIVVACVIIAEIGGVSLIYHKINIPPERIEAALWVFQFALLMVCSQLLSIPFEACVIAHEDMNIYSYMGVFEGVMRLVIAFLISLVPFDRLVFYAMLMCLVTVLTQSGYTLYAFRHYKECFIKYYWNQKYLKESFSFVGWNIVGTARAAVITQGMDFVLNVFLGPVANAARGVTNQVSGAIFKFSSNVLVAAQPQLVKLYANEECERLNRLFFKTSLFSFYVLWVLVCPLIFNLDSVLHIWLKEVPMWTKGFLTLQLCTSLIYVLTRPLWSIIIAVGVLKKYVIWDTVTSVLTMPLAIVVLKLGCAPEYVYVIILLVQVLNTAVLLGVVDGYINFGLFNYLKIVVFRLFIVSLISIPITWALSIMLVDGLVGLMIAYVIGFVIVSAIVLFVGVDKGDRMSIISKTKSRFFHHN